MRKIKRYDCCDRYGQLVSANYGDGKSEDFLWDGLALVKRGDEQYINEPHVGNAPQKLCFGGKPRAKRSARRARKGPRGNPVVSSSGTSYFNDILGTTLGSKAKGKKYSAAALSAFGEDLSVETNGRSHSHSTLSTLNSQFFTGKPHVAGLGHAFLFRNYRAGLAKWQTADPLGYPDGWNQLAYCGNGVINGVDLLGCATVTSRVVTGGSPSDPTYGGETGCNFKITSVNMLTFKISVELIVNISYCANLDPSASYAKGTIVTYVPHDGASGGNLSPCVREAAEAHENGHADYATNDIRSEMESALDFLEIEWRVQGWSESRARNEVSALCYSVLFNHVNRFHNAANDPTIAWFESSPEWKLVHDDKSFGFWSWIKE